MYEHKSKDKPETLWVSMASSQPCTYMAVEICVEQHHRTGEAVDSVYGKTRPEGAHSLSPVGLPLSLKEPTLRTYESTILQLGAIHPIGLGRQKLDQNKSLKTSELDSAG